MISNNNWFLFALDFHSQLMFNSILLPVQNYYASHKSHHNSKISFYGTREIRGMKPAASVIRNLMAYATALSIFNTRSLGSVTILLN